MKIAIVVLFAVMSLINADPEPESFAEPSKRSSKTKEIFVNIYEKACKNDNGSDEKCKEWSPEKFCICNIKEWGVKFAKEVNEYCDEHQDNLVSKVICKIHLSLANVFAFAIFVLIALAVSPSSDTMHEKFLTCYQLKN